MRQITITRIFTTTVRSAYIILLYLTLPYFTLLYITLPYVNLLYITLSYFNLPYCTLLCLTLPYCILLYLILPYLNKILIFLLFLLWFSLSISERTACLNAVISFRARSLDNAADRDHTYIYDHRASRA